MRPIAIAVLLLTVNSILQAQDLNFDLKFESKEDYRTNEEEVGRIAAYLLSVPVKDPSHSTKVASATLLKWMTGTPDYNFELDETISSLSKANEDVLVPILASMTSYVLKNKDKAGDKAEVKLNTYILFLQYCEDKSHGVKHTKEIRRAIEAKNKGELKKYLNL